MLTKQYVKYTWHLWIVKLNFR